MLKETHDQLLAEKPESAEHDDASCLFCNGLEVSEAIDNGPQGGSAVKTYTEEEYDSILAQVATLEAKVTELQGARQESEVEAKIAEIKAQAEDQVAELQTKLDDQVAGLQAQLDTAVLETEAAKTEKDELLSYFESLEAEKTRAEEIAALREQRVALVKENTSFPESRITERADAWAAMDEDAFTAALEDWKAIAPKVEGKVEIPVQTAMSASRSDNSSGDTPLRDVLALRFKGVDIRKMI